MKFNQKQEVSHSGSNKFLKVGDGQSVNGVFRGEIYTFYNKWVNGKGMTCSPDDPGAKPRFKLNFVTMEDGKFVAKIFEFPQTVYNLLSDINDVYPLDKTKVKVSRRGTGTDTTYNILPLVNEPISGTTLNQIESVALQVLDDKSPPRSAQQAKTPMPEAHDELPF